MFDKLNVAEAFNKFYTSVASKLVEKLPLPFHKFGKNFVIAFYAAKGVFPNSHSFYSVSENKGLSYLNKLGAQKATGLDGIPSRFVKDSSTIIASPLSHIINLSLIQGVVPDDLKTARVVTLLRKMIKLRWEITVLCPYLVLFPKYLKGLFLIKWKTILRKRRYYISSNLASGVGFPSNLSYSPDRFY